MILIDNRIGSAEIAQYITQPHMLCKLDYADFSWPGNGPDGVVTIGVERKGVMDLLQSMTSGRLSGHQLIGLSAEYDKVYLLVEGIWRPDKKTGVLMRVGNNGKWVAAAQGSRRFMARDVYNYFNTLQIICGVTVILTSNQWETGKWLDTCYGWWSKEWNKHKSHLQFQKPVTHAQLVKPNLVTRVASQFNNIGWDKAKKIGKRFKLLKDFMEADEDDLMEIKGIGPKLAKSIVLQKKGEEI